jgi:hypothetical protein
MVNIFSLTRVTLLSCICDINLHLFLGYCSTPYTVRPFDETELSKAPDEVTYKRMRAFNKRLSGVRITVEHAFGRLKGRFRALKEMGPHEDIQEMYKAIEALLILHNICIDLGDKPEEIWDFDPKDDFEETEEDPDPDLEASLGEFEELDAIPGHETDAWLKRQGRRKRMIIFNELFPAD